MHIEEGETEGVHRHSVFRLNLRYYVKRDGTKRLVLSYQTEEIIKKSHEWDETDNFDTMVYTAINK